MLALTKRSRVMIPSTSGKLIIYDVKVSGIFSSCGKLEHFNCKSIKITVKSENFQGKLVQTLFHFQEYDITIKHKNSLSSQ